CHPRPILQTCPSLLSIRHSRITSESLTTSAGEQQPHVRDVLEGTTPDAFVLERRLARARELLTRTDLSYPK
ncbi:MAG: hypothetical protein WCC90_15465, partial [Methylocella sp.]